jgi:hypothetical protein
MTRHKFIFLTAVSALGSLLFAVGGLLFGEHSVGATPKNNEGPNFVIRHRTI